MDKRILYYLIKVNKHADKMRIGKTNKYRYERLMKYKAAIYERNGVS